MIFDDPRKVDEELQEQVPLGRSYQRIRDQVLRGRPDGRADIQAEAEHSIQERQNNVQEDPQSHREAPGLHASKPKALQELQPVGH